MSINISAVDDIVNSMSEKDKEFLNISDDHFEQTSENRKIIEQFIKTVDGEPVSFLEIIGDSSGIALAIGTRDGDKCRNKGYGKSVALQGKKWLDNHFNEFNQIVWWVRKDNLASIKIAESIGFELDNTSVLPNDNWIKYEYQNKEI